MNLIAVEPITVRITVNDRQAKIHKLPAKGLCFFAARSVNFAIVMMSNIPTPLQVRLLVNGHDPRTSRPHAQDDLGLLLPPYATIKLPGWGGSGQRPFRVAETVESVARFRQAGCLKFADPFGEHLFPPIFYMSIEDVMGEVKAFYGHDLPSAP